MQSVAICCLRATPPRPISQTSPTTGVPHIRSAVMSLAPQTVAIVAIGVAILVLKVWALSS